MTHNLLYTDLSGYYDLMCADIDYRTQSDAVHRLHQLFGNGGKHYLDLACGTGPHLEHFIARGYQAWGLDLNQPMLDRAARRCPTARLICSDMAHFSAPEPLDLISCFLYSVHYNNNVNALRTCFETVHRSLNTGGLFCFNAVDCQTIAGSQDICHELAQDGNRFRFQSGWRYCGTGERQHLYLSIQKIAGAQTHAWTDQHPMVAVTFAQLTDLLAPAFEVQTLAHDYQKIQPWDGKAGNALFVCVKK